MTKPINLAAVEIQKKVDAAVAAEIAKGRRAEDFDEAFLNALVKDVQANLSPAAVDQAAMDGLTLIAEQVCGSFIAEEMWKAGCGWDASDEEILKCGRLARISNDDIFDSLAAFREVLPDLTFDLAKDFPCLGRFMALFVLQPEGSKLGQIAARKAKLGDKLALSFLAWKEIK